MNKERLLARDRAYNQAHRETQRRWHHDHAEEKKEYLKAYYLGNRANLRKKQQEHYQTHKGKKDFCTKRAIIQAYRRSQKKNLPATLTLEQWEAIKAAYDYCCAYCDSKPKRLTQDHVIPVSKGGGYTANNIVPACGSCNSSKGNKEPEVLPAVRLLI